MDTPTGVNEDPLLAGAYEAFNEGTKSGYKMALIESAKILDAILIKKGFPGNTPDERVRSAKNYIPNYDRLMKANDKKNVVISDLEYELSLDFIREALAAYSLAVRSLFEVKPHGMTGTYSLMIRMWYDRVGAVKLALYFFGFVAAIIFLSKTGPGSALVSGFLSLIDFLVTSILLLAALGAVVVASFVYFERRRAKSS